MWPECGASLVNRRESIEPDVHQIESCFAWRWETACCTTCLGAGEDNSQVVRRGVRRPLSSAPGECEGPRRATVPQGMRDGGANRRVGVGENHWQEAIRPAGCAMPHQAPWPMRGEPGCLGKSKTISRSLPRRLLSRADVYGR